MIAIFQSTRPLRGGTSYFSVFAGVCVFQSTRPLRGGTSSCYNDFRHYPFQSTRPLRGGTRRCRNSSAPLSFQSTRPLRGGTWIDSFRIVKRRISIHPPLAGRDRRCLSVPLDQMISIHPPLAGRDRLCVQICHKRGDFNPPAPCGAGRGIMSPAIIGRLFQSTRPLRGGTIAGGAGGRRLLFQSTRPLRGGTEWQVPIVVHLGISIHPPLAGRDCHVAPPLDVDRISIHPPLAGRDKIAEERSEYNRFQSTRPLRGGTAILHKKTVQNIAYCTKSAFTLAVLSGFLALLRPFFLPNVHKFRCEPSEESLLAPRSHAYTIRTPSC